VFRLAGELGLSGWVLNDAHGVLLEIEGPTDSVEAFLSRLAPEAPPLAVIERVEVGALALLGERTFEIHESPRGELADAPVAPDTATCTDCLRELLDPADRRYRYPFINCTNCGPRFTIVQGVPYDRPATTMAGFQMCAACSAEYRDPADRRFHAQPNACPECGPSVRLLRADGTLVEVGDPVAAAADAMRDGKIVAVKGIGGLHLACLANDEGAVRALRDRKQRENKPFALIVATADEAAALVELGEAERELLTALERPIVLAPRLAGADVAPSVAPAAKELGVMLPYSPLHHLLLRDVGCALVMTSGNVSDEPIVFRDQETVRLTGIADLLLLHDRPIETRTDDSVVRAVTIGEAPQPMFLRRSRGYVPSSMRLPDPASRPILACGAELKNTFCLAKGERAWVSHHIGDLENYETLRSFSGGIDHFRELFAVTPELIAHDLHPEYLSTKYALDLAAVSGAELVPVQHHHAHLAACLAEYGETGVAIGAIFDGTGLGPDGTVWGGELLVGDLSGYERFGALKAVRLPGGTRAIQEPWRMACSWLTAAEGPSGGAPAVPPTLRSVIEERRWRQVAELARNGLNSPITTSMGRLFDAVAALCGFSGAVSYEGQAAIEFEAVCDPSERGRYELELDRANDGLVIDPTPALRALRADLAAGAEIAAISARFHAGVAAATVDSCAAAASAAGTELVVLSGGVFQNRRLLETTAAGLGGLGLRVLMPRLLPPGDGGISYGQAAIAAHRLATGAPR
jgi:hydrogenase maturation protein HypF